MRMKNNKKKIKIKNNAAIFRKKGTIKYLNDKKKTKKKKLFNLINFLGFFFF
jgi:hypothetical protein